MSDLMQDLDFILDVHNIVEEYDVDMDEFRAAVDFDVSDDGEELDNECEENEEVEIV